MLSPNETSQNVCGPLGTAASPSDPGTGFEIVFNVPGTAWSR